MGSKDQQLLFEQLVTQYVDIVHYVAYNLCGQKDDADELAQETFLRAYRGFANFRTGSNFKAWILKILRNLYIDYQKKQQKLPLTVSIEMLPNSMETSSEAMEIIDIESKEIFYDLFSDEIAEFLQRLPKDQQLCLVLCDVEGLNYQEISEILGCPIGTIRSRIHRARALFQQYVREYAKNIGYLQRTHDEL